MKIINRNKVLFFILGILFIAVNNSNIFAQSMCNLVKLKVNKVAGKVVTNEKDPYPFSNTKVELFRDNSLVTTTYTNKAGFFEIGDAASGKYLLRIWATTEKGLTLFEYDLLLELKNNKRESAKLILVLLGMGCQKSNAKLIKS